MRLTRNKQMNSMLAKDSEMEKNSMLARNSKEKPRNKPPVLVWSLELQYRRGHQGAVISP